MTLGQILAECGIAATKEHGHNVRDWVDCDEQDRAIFERCAALFLERVESEAWQPIATAPMGPSLFANADASERAAMRKPFIGTHLVTGVWANGLKRTATHWRPIPAPPKVQP